MPNLASLVMVVFFWMHSQFGIKGIPLPVIIQTGNVYSVSEIYSTITVPLDWQGDCYDQKNFVHYMSLYYNSFLNGNQKKTDRKLRQIEDAWVCVQ